MSDRWERQQVLGLAPDTASVKAAAAVARPARWSGLGEGAAPGGVTAVWGECQGSGAGVYRTCVDLTGPAFHCSCPSHKFPCKHALGLLLLWSDGAGAPAEPPGWAAEWLARRAERAAPVTTAPGGAGGRPKDPRTVERREQRVDDGVDDLDRWLRDQVAHGLAHAEKAPYGLWDDTARRLVDAQASALAGQVRALSSIPLQAGRGPRAGRGHEPDWPERLLEEYALLRLLTTAYRRRDALPAGLAATVRARVGFTMAQEEVLHGESGDSRAASRVRDRWYVAGVRDTEQDRLLTRRVWLRGQSTGRPALILSFAGPGRTLDTSFVAGTTVDAELAFYPGAQPMRALPAERYGGPLRESPRGTTVGGLLEEYAAALARDPWLDRWPAVLSEVRPARGSGCGREWHVVDEAGDAVPLRTADPWRLLALCGGRPVTVAGEWSPRGLHPLSAVHPEEGTVIL